LYAEEEVRASFAQRAGGALDRAEGFYLRVLRAVILVIATLLLAYATWLAASSAYKISRSPDSVVETETRVLPDELTDAQLPAEASGPAAKAQPSTNLAYQRFYNAFVNKYFALYQSKFEPYRQAEDKKLSRSEFDGVFLNTPDRISAISRGDLAFEDDRADLETLYSVMSGAADRPVTLERLQRYKLARKKAVTKQVERTRTSYVRGWDSSATSCELWYESPIGCPVRRPVESTYTESVTTSEFPKGTQSHTQIFKAFQDRFFSLLQERREANAQKAEQERQSIIGGIADGHVSLFTAFQIIGAFLALMFFFLLIAIERHQRRIAALSPISTRTPE
jgi:hypothetical protein